MIFEFDASKPPIGIYGFSGSKYINGLSFISYDTESDCQNYVPPLTPEVDSTVSTPDTSKDNDTAENSD